MTPNPSVTAGTTPTVTPSTTPTSSALPHFDHIVVVIEENKGYPEIIGSTSAPYINSLAAQGMLFTNSHAITHPSEPNYLDLFSGSDQGVVGDACDSSAYAPPDLGGQLLSAKYSFAGYSEGLSAAGDTSCSHSATAYARKHVPWANFSDTNGPTTNLPYTSFPTTTAGYSSLPTVSFVIPNLNNDMHDGSIQQGDTWLQQNMDAYAQWAKTNNSLLLVTWDENDTSTLDASNQIATIFVGQHVQVGTNNTSINHFSVLRTLEDMYGLSPINGATNASDILGVWN
jgi:acid phosphatase